jgi:hypothetical protein
VSHAELGTLQSYVAALGGNLRVVADFGESTVELSKSIPPMRDE